MKKLTDLINEEFAFDRSFGEPLPTLEDTIKKHSGEIVEASDAQNKRAIKRFLIDALTYLGYISKDPDWRKHATEAEKVQDSLAALLKKLK